MTKKDILAFVESGGQARLRLPRRSRRRAAPEPAPPHPRAAPARPPGGSRASGARAPAPLRCPAGSAAAHRRPSRCRAGSGREAEPEPGETIEPMSAMRKGIAEHMRRSLDTSAHVTSAIEVDMSKVVAIRKKLKKEYEQAYGVNPTYLPSSPAPRSRRCASTRGSTARSAATRS